MNWKCFLGWHDWHAYRSQRVRQDKQIVEFQVTCGAGVLIAGLVGLFFFCEISAFIGTIGFIIAGIFAMLLAISYRCTRILGGFKVFTDCACLRCRRVRLTLSKREYREKDAEEREAQRQVLRKKREQERNEQINALHSEFNEKRLEHLSRWIER